MGERGIGSLVLLVPSDGQPNNHVSVCGRCLPYLAQYSQAMGNSHKTSVQHT